MAGAPVLRIESIAWNDPGRSSSAPAELVRKAQASGARRKHHASLAYGFTCGAQGMEFLTIRSGDARFESRG